MRIDIPFAILAVMRMNVDVNIAGFWSCCRRFRLLPVRRSHSFEEVLWRGFGAGPKTLGHDLCSRTGPTIIVEPWARTEEKPFLDFFLVGPRTHLSSYYLFGLDRAGAELLPVRKRLRASTRAKHVRRPSRQYLRRCHVKSICNVQRGPCRVQYGVTGLEVISRHDPGVLYVEGTHDDILVYFRSLVGAKTLPYEHLPPRGLDNAVHAVDEVVKQLVTVGELLVLDPLAASIARSLPNSSS